MARVIVNDDGKGGTAPDPLVWCWPDIVISEDDVGLWLFSVALVKLAAFLSSLSWPSEVSDLGNGGAET